MLIGSSAAPSFAESACFAHPVEVVGWPAAKIVARLIDCLAASG